MKDRLLQSTAVAFALLNLAPAMAQTAAPAAAAQTADDNGLAEITVTARNRSEKLQSVPDSITAFSPQAIVNANIKNIGDLARITPGLNFRDGRAFSSNFFDIRMRGIGSAQGGFPSVSVIVDGVPNDSGDALTSGSLNDVERIEVLRGPQSALYGAGAIAGAINVVTKRPTNDFHAAGRLYYGNGNDVQAQASVAGALVDDKILARLSTNYRNDDGRLNSQTNGIHLDPHDRKQVAARVILDPTEKFEADLNGSYNIEKGGYAFQARVPTIGNLNDLVNQQGVLARRTPGSQTRKFTRLSARLSYDFGGASLTSVSAYSRTRQNGFGSACYDDVTNPSFRDVGGGELCLGNTRAFGDAATTGQVRERFQYGSDNLSSYFQDLRLTSQTSGPISWLVGGSGLWRTVHSTSGGYNEVAGTIGQVPTNLTVNLKKDRWWGVYGQISAKFGNLELTANGRYDHQRYYNTSFSDAAFTNILQVRDVNGNLINTQAENANKFQPKGQISYHVDPDKMLYVTVSKGFRAGYFNSGSFAIPEHTTNYEAGFKTEWLNRRLIVNAAGFHIDYSNQQLSATTNTPPFRVPVTVPKTTINGAELEVTARLAPVFTLSGNLAYLHAEIDGGFASPKAPKWSGSISGQLNQPVGGDWVLNGHADLSFHSSQYLFLNNTQLIDAKRYVNVRIGLEKPTYGIYFVGSNLTNTHESQVQTGTTTPYRVIYPVDPRSYGVELRVNF